MNFSIKLNGKNDQLPQTLFNTSTLLKSGDSVELPGGATLIYKDINVSRIKGTSEVIWILELLIDLGKGVSSGLFVAWLIKLIEKHPRQSYLIDNEIITDQTEIHLHEDKVKRIIHKRTKEIKQL